MKLSINNRQHKISVSDRYIILMMLVMHDIDGNTKTVLIYQDICLSLFACTYQASILKLSHISCVLAILYHSLQMLDGSDGSHQLSLVAFDLKIF